MNKDLCRSNSLPARRKRIQMSLDKIVYPAPSSIHGTGLFAKTLIRKGHYIGSYEGPEARRNGKYVLWVYYDDGNVVGRRGLNLLRYMNHCDKPNAELDGFDLYALRTIKADEEITINYGAYDEGN